MLEMKQRLARLLLEKSYREGDFTLSSGRKSEYYFDCRQSALHPEGAWLIGNLFFAALPTEIPVVAVGGMTLGADPLVSATCVISWEKSRPLAGLLVRKEAKKHGTGQYIEGLGNVASGAPVAVLEDVVSSGASLLTACQRIQEAGLTVTATYAVLDREEGGREAIENAGFRLHSLFTRKELVAMGVGRDKF